MKRGHTRARLVCTAILVMTVSAAESAGRQPQESDRPPDAAAVTPSALSRPTTVPVIDGPPAPVAPDVITRDEGGRATMRAVRLDRPLTIDGRLDEEIYSVVSGAGGFIQQEPHEGEPATEKTEAWIFFDDRNVYVVARCWDGSPDRWVVNELQRDGDVTQNESMSVQFDTFYDHRNGFFFQTSPAGALRDQTFTDEGNLNLSWNAVWDVRSARFDGGWTMEMVIPFKSIRYAGSGPQVWGVQFRRIVKWKNETSLLTRVPAAYGFGGAFRASTFATLTGLETPAQSMNLELKPYVASAVTTDRRAAVPYSNNVSPNGGFDLKYGLSRSLTADVTYNTDFAQVEEDVQQVNLTRFSLFFPEKREFFLEGQGIFGFSGVALGGGFGGGGGANDVPILFFSRRIGLSQGQSVPVVAGGRLTGKAGRFSIGALNVRTDDKPSAAAVATDFSVLRLKRDVLRRSSIGILAARRSHAIADTGSNLTVGLDANMQFFRNVAITSYYARTRTPGLRGDESSYRGRFDYAADRYGVLIERVMVGDSFNPEVGFTRRTDFRRDSAQLRFSPRPASSRLIRKLNWQASFDYITDAAGEALENKEAQGTFRADFNNSDHWTVDYTHAFEYLPEGFQIATGVRLPAGEYRYQFVGTQYGFGQQRMISGRVSGTWGTFYGGDRTEASVSGGRVNLSRHFSIEPGLTLNWVELPQGSFRSRLMTARTIIMPSPRMAISSLVQYNANGRTLGSSMRLRWEYTPGSELFVVFSDGRDTSARGAPELLNRSLVLKVTRLLRF